MTGPGTPFCASCGKEKLGRTLQAARCFACQHVHKRREQKRYDGNRPGRFKAERIELARAVIKRDATGAA